MTAILESLSSGDRFVFLVVSVVMVTSTLIPVAIVGFVQWRKVRERETMTGLVHDMLARGFSPDEIEQVFAGTNLESSSTDSIVAKSKEAFACRV